MEEDDSKARERAKLQDKKSKLEEAANYLGQLVQDLGIVPENVAVDPFAMDEDEMEPIRPDGRRSASIPNRQRAYHASVADAVDDEDLYN